MVSRYPFHGRTRRGGCSRVEHRLFGAVVLVASQVPASSSGGWWNVGRGGVVSGTLLGPEGSGVFCSVFQCGPCLLVVPLWSLGFPWGVWLAAGEGWGSARILRTTQWTRASLWPSL